MVSISANDMIRSPERVCWTKDVTSNVTQPIALMFWQESIAPSGGWFRHVRTDSDIWHERSEGFRAEKQWQASVQSAGNTRMRPPVMNSAAAQTTSRLNHVVRNRPTPNFVKTAHAITAVTNR